MLNDIKSGIYKGIGLLMVFCGAIFAYTVSGTIKTWSTGETLTATDLNTTIQSLKTSLENASQVGSAAVTISTISMFQTFLGSPNTISNLEPPVQWPATRAGTVKSARLMVVSNNCINLTEIKLRKNGIDTALVLSVPAGSTAQATSSSTVSFAAGDLLHWSGTSCATGGLAGNIHFEF